MQQCTGFMGYLTQMGYATSLIDFNVGEYVPFMMGFCLVIGALISIFLFPRVARAKMILIGNAVMTICTICIGICFLYLNNNYKILWVLLAFVIVFMLINGICLIPCVMPYVNGFGSK
jgi:MFS family permease